MITAESCLPVVRLRPLTIPVPTALLHAEDVHAIDVESTAHIDTTVWGIAAATAAASSPPYYADRQDILALFTPLEQVPSDVNDLSAPEPSTKTTFRNVVCDVICLPIAVPLAIFAAVCLALEEVWNRLRRLLDRLKHMVYPETLESIPESPADVQVWLHQMRIKKSVRTCFNKVNGAKFLASGESVESLKRLGVHDEHAHSVILPQVAAWCTIQAAETRQRRIALLKLVYASLEEMPERLMVRINRGKLAAADFETTLARDVNAFVNDALSALERLVIAHHEREGTESSSRLPASSYMDLFKGFGKANAQSHNKLLASLLASHVELKATAMHHIVTEVAP